MKPAQLFEKWYISERRACKLRVTSKDQELKWLWKAIHWILFVVSFGRQKTFYTEYTTTVGNVIYYRAGWRRETAELKDCVILGHEGRHVRQFIKWGLGSAKIGILIMGLLYLFVPLPVCFAWFRYRFEREAYKVSYYLWLELGGDPGIEYCVENLTAGQYLWTWVLKKQVRKWFQKHCRPELLDQNRSILSP